MQKAPHKARRYRIVPGARPKPGRTLDISRYCDLQQYPGCSRGRTSTHERQHVSNHSTTSNGRISWIDAARGISIVLVVLYHSETWALPAGIHVPDALASLNDAATFRMPLFFLVAGMLGYKWAQKPWSDLRRNKLAYLVWPFLIWQVAVLAYKLIAAAVFPEYRQSYTTVVLMAVLSPLRPNGETWFLWALALYFIAAKLLARAPRLVVTVAAIVVSIAWGQYATLVIPARLVDAMGPGLMSTPEYFAFFIAGLLFSSELRRAISSVPLWATPVPIVTWGVWEITNATAWDAPGIVLADQILGVAMGLSAARLLAWFTPLVVLGRQTIAVYLSHCTTIVFAYGAWVLASGGTGAGIVPFAAALLALAVGYALQRTLGTTWLFEPPAEAWARRKPRRAA